MWKRTSLFAVFAVLLFHFQNAAAATVEVVSPQGLRVWLVEDHSHPVLTLGFRFAGGSDEDPAGKEGVAHLAAELFFDGGGALDADAYLGRWAEVGAEINVESRLESIRGTVRVLTPDRADAMKLLQLAVEQPRYDTDTIEQVRGQIAAELDRDADDPESSAFLKYDQLGFAAHVRARPVGGTRPSLAAITAADLAHYRRGVMARDGLSLAAVGDISPADLGPLVDRIFGDLPAHNHVIHPPPAPDTSAMRFDLAEASDQAEVVFGLSLPGLDSRQRSAAEILNYIFGGSAFTSRLYHEVREKRGLAYSIGTNLDTYSFASELSGSFGSAPETVEEAIAIVRHQFAGLAENLPTDEEVAEAKAALAGDYLRSLIRQTDMANELTLRMGQGANPDCIETYAARLAAVAADDVRALAKGTPWLDRLVVVTVGTPAYPEAARGERSRLHEPPAPEP